MTTPPLNDAPYLIEALCHLCHTPTSQCAECAVTMEIDPLCGLPIDVGIGPDLKIIRWTPEQIPAEIRQRAVPAFICDTCVAQLNRMGKTLVSATDRHALGTCPNAAR